MLDSPLRKKNRLAVNEEWVGQYNTTNKEMGEISVKCTLYLSAQPAEEA